jgi:adenylate kinase
MILLMGIAGSGKGTQGKMLADEHNYHLISMGDVLRMYITGELREKMLRGELLGDDDIIGIIDGVLKTLPDDEQVILDGFPRTIPQAEWLIGQVEKGRFKLEKALHLVASKDAVKERLLNRARIDDDDDAIEARFAEYERSTTPLIEWLKHHGVDVVEINAVQSVDDVHNEIVNSLGI